MFRAALFLKSETVNDPDEFQREKEINQGILRDEYYTQLYTKAWLIIKNAVKVKHKSEKQKTGISFSQNSKYKIHFCHIHDKIIYKKIKYFWAVTTHSRVEGILKETHKHMRQH